MGLNVVLDVMDEGLCGYYDKATETVYINRALDARGRRSTLVHELIHWERGHGPTDSLPEYLARDIEVEHETARRLISFPALVWAVTSYGSEKERSEALDVDVALYHARVLAMNRLEQLVFDVCALRCIGVNTELALTAGNQPALLNLPHVLDERILDEVMEGGPVIVGALECVAVA